MVNNAIGDEVLVYALPVYNSEFLQNIENYENIEMPIEPEILLEVFLLRIQVGSTKYSSRLKKNICQLENKLLGRHEIYRT